MSDENKYSAIKKVLYLEFQDCRDTLFVEGPNIFDWPNYKFSADGRVFGFFEDGRSIGKRLQAREIGVNKYDWERLEKTAGMILIQTDGVCDDPLVYRDEYSLVKMWLELHNSFGVPLSDEELARFEFYIEPEEDEDEK